MSDYDRSALDYVAALTDDERRAFLDAALNRAHLPGSADAQIIAGAFCPGPGLTTPDQSKGLNQ